ncbi:MAG: metal ABC transporter substrate-binding protein [Actinomycetota bacterium]
MVRRLVAMVWVALVANGCTSEPVSDQGLTVVASFYPLAEAAERVTGDLGTVLNLTPSGVEPHDLELAPDDVEALVTADVVVYLGGGFQPAVEDAVGQAEGTVVDVLASSGELLPPADGDEELAGDPHVWLDPERFAAIVDAVADALAGVDPGSADPLRERAASFRGELEALDDELAEGLASCERRLLVVNHAAFGYLADAYDLEQVAISGLAPEAEPDPARLAELRTLVQDEGVTTIFTEELASPEVAEALADDVGVTTAVLNPLEGLTDDEFAAGEDYGSVMRENLSTLRGALGCA